MQNNVLIAREGYIYTNGETFGYTIRLGANDSADNWHEVPEAEYEAIQKDILESEVNVDV